MKMHVFYRFIDRNGHNKVEDQPIVVNEHTPILSIQTKLDSLVEKCIGKCKLDPDSEAVLFYCPPDGRPPKALKKASQLAPDGSRRLLNQNIVRRYDLEFLDGNGRIIPSNTLVTNVIHVDGSFTTLSSLTMQLEETEEYDDLVNMLKIQFNIGSNVQMSIYGPKRQPLKNVKTAGDTGKGSFPPPKKIFFLETGNNVQDPATKRQKTMETHQEPVPVPFTAAAVNGSSSAVAVNGLSSAANGSSSAVAVNGLSSAVNGSSSSAPGPSGQATARTTIDCHFPALAIDLTKQLQSGVTGTLKFNCADAGRKKRAPLTVHRAILTARSSIFAAMLLPREDGTLSEEAQSGVADIDDIDADVMAQFVDALCTGKCSFDCDSTLSKLFYAAAKYEVGDLQEKCEELLMQRLHLDNVVDVALLANRHCAEKLRAAAIEFMKTHANAVVDDANSSKKLSENPEMLMSVLRAVVKN